MKKIRMTCRACDRRSNFYPKIRVRQLRGKFIKEIYFKCPKCFHDGWFRFKRRN